MIELLLRRRQMAMSKKQPFINPYITDGLILHLDGIEKGSTPDAWTDLINGIVFTKKAGGVTFNSDNVQFEGTSANQCLYSSDSFVPPNTFVGTVQICYRDCVHTSNTVNSILYTGNVSGAINFTLHRMRVMYASHGANAAMAVWDGSATGTYSISSNLAYQNMRNVGFTSSKDYSSRNANVVIVGASGRGASTFYDQYKGKLHSVRVYNRHLTEEEVLHNQAIDNTRFNLGLQI